MRVDMAVDQLLSPYMSRVHIHPGNCLTNAMNSSLRSYPEIPRIIKRTVTLLVTTEILFDLSGKVAIKNGTLYDLLIEIHPDWHRDLPDRNGRVRFVRKPLVPIHQFAAAWTIGRHVQLLDGHGKVRLHPDALSTLRSWYDKV